MEKEKIVDLINYRETKTFNEAKSALMSEELKNAIQSLIHRLKEEGPLSQPA